MDVDPTENRMAIPGIPGAPEPTFRTRDREYVSLDQLIQEVCAELASRDILVDAPIAKAAVQCARQSVQVSESPGLDGLAQQVSEDLRRERVHLVPRLVRQVLLAYGRIVSDLDIAETIDQL
jgi:hypothetical protein